MGAVFAAMKTPYGKIQLIAIALTKPIAVPPLLVAESVPPVNDKPEPTVTAEIAVPLPCNKPVMLVVNVIAGVVVGLATVPVKPFADTTETVVTVPELVLIVDHVPSPRK